MRGIKVNKNPQLLNPTWISRVITSHHNHHHNHHLHAVGLIICWSLHRQFRDLTVFCLLPTAAGDQGSCGCPGQLRSGVRRTRDLRAALPEFKPSICCSVWLLWPSIDLWLCQLPHTTNINPHFVSLCVFQRMVMISLGKKNLKFLATSCTAPSWPANELQRHRDSCLLSETPWRRHKGPRYETQAIVMLLLLPYPPFKSRLPSLYCSLPFLPCPPSFFPTCLPGYTVTTISLGFSSYTKCPRKQY